MTDPLQAFYDAARQMHREGYDLAMVIRSVVEKYGIQLAATSHPTQSGAANGLAGHSLPASPHNQKG